MLFISDSQALVSTEPNLQGRPCFQKIMRELLQLARPTASSLENTAQVCIYCDSLLQLINTGINMLM